MNYSEAVQEITEVIPDFENELTKNIPQNPYHVIRNFTEHIKNMVRQNDRNILFKSLQKMDKIYTNGDTGLKNAIEGIFVYSLDNFTVFCGREYRKMIFSQLSRELQQTYTRQIYSHGN